MPLFLMGCFPVDFQEVKRPLRTKSVKRPIKVGKRPINEGKRPIKAKVLVGVSVGCLMGCFRAPQPWRKTAPLKRPIKRSKNPRAHKIRVRNSGAGNGCANFMDAWKKCVLSAGKPMSIKFLVLGGGGYFGFGRGGGGSADFIFMGAGIFLIGVSRGNTIRGNRTERF